MRRVNPYDEAALVRRRELEEATRRLLRQPAASEEVHVARKKKTETETETSLDGPNVSDSFADGAPSVAEVIGEPTAKKKRGRKPRQPRSGYALFQEGLAQLRADAEAADHLTDGQREIALRFLAGLARVLGEADRELACEEHTSVYAEILDLGASEQDGDQPSLGLFR